MEAEESVHVLLAFAVSIEARTWDGKRTNTWGEKVIVLRIFQVIDSTNPYDKQANAYSNHISGS